MFDRSSNTTQMILRFHRIISITIQLALMVVANRLAFLLRFDGNIPAWANETFVSSLAWLLAIRVLTFVPFRLYQGLWRYTSVYDLMALVGGISASTAIFYVYTISPLGPAVYPRSIFIIDALLAVLLLGGIRLSRRMVGELSRGGSGRRILVFGAGDAGEMIVRDMKNNGWYSYRPIGFIDDDRSKVGRRIHGVPVLGGRADLPRIMDEYDPHEVLIAIPKAEPAVMRAIVRALEPFKIPIKTLPNLRDIIDGKVELGQIRSLSVEDLLARAPVGLDPRPLKRLIEGRRVMVTGAGGSIGSELCRQIASLKPASLVMFERYENSLHAIRMELEDAHHAFGLHPVIGDVADLTRVNEVLELYKPEIMFHAAAHKHVPLMEENPCEAIKNNVRGTRLLAHAAERHGVDRFILISTDKAVNPTNVMGASKRLAELIVQKQSQGSGTSFCTVRFGNVLGSNGSVIPRFLEQIKNGGPVTITHPEIKRFFMLIPEAVQLVLHAAAQGRGGATYVLEMGEQVRLLDMARDLIRLSGLVPEEDIPIEFVGLRPGEKLYEELVGLGEDVHPSSVEKVLCVTARRPPEEGLVARIEALEASAAAANTKAVLAGLKQLIPEYHDPGTSSVVTQHDEPATVAVEAAMAMGASDLHRPCPKCASVMHRSRTRRWHERVHRKFTERRPFRCGGCGYRAWLVPLQFGPQATMPIEGAPDLAALDALATAPASPHRQSFSPRDLQ